MSIGQGRGCQFSWHVESFYFVGDVRRDMDGTALDVRAATCWTSKEVTGCQLALFTRVEEIIVNFFVLILAEDMLYIIRLMILVRHVLGCIHRPFEISSRNRYNVFQTTVIQQDF